MHTEAGEGKREGGDDAGVAPGAPSGGGAEAYHAVRALQGHARAPPRAGTAPLPPAGLVQERGREGLYRVLEEVGGGGQELQRQRQVRGGGGGDGGRLHGFAGLVVKI